MKSLKNYLNEALITKKAQGPGFTYNWYIAPAGTKFKSSDSGEQLESVAEITNEATFIEAQKLAKGKKFVNDTNKAIEKRNYKEFRKWMDDEFLGDKYSHYTLYKNKSGKFGVDATREIVTK